MTQNRSATMRGVRGIDPRGRSWWPRLVRTAGACGGCGCQLGGGVNLADLVAVGLTLTGLVLPLLLAWVRVRSRWPRTPVTLSRRGRRARSSRCVWYQGNADFTFVVARYSSDSTPACWLSTGDQTHVGVVRNEAWAGTVLLLHSYYEQRAAHASLPPGHPACLMQPTNQIVTERHE